VDGMGKKNHSYEDNWSDERKNGIAKQKENDTVIFWWGYSDENTYVGKKKYSAPGVHLGT